MNQQSTTCSSCYGGQLLERCWNARVPLKSFVVSVFRRRTETRERVKEVE
jgi:hypothetical protein